MDEEMSDRAAEMMIRILLFYRELFKKGKLMKLTGIQEAEFRLIHRLYYESPMSMSTLGGQLYISRPHMTTLIDRLIENGMVERLPDPDDRRVINVNITQKGRESLEGACKALKKSFKSQVSSLEFSDLEIICSSAERLLSVLSRLP